MRKQQRIWHDEHTNQGTLPAMAHTEPASGVIQFTDWLRGHDFVLSGKAVDIGMGKGRNGVYLAKLGFEVWALEYIETKEGRDEMYRTLWPQNGKFQKDYDEAELREFYKEFEVIELKKISKPVFKLGRKGTATNFWMVLRKESEK